MSSEVQISPAIHDPQGQEKQQQAAGVGILLQIMMLVLSFVLGHVLRRHKFYYLPEASASLLIGLFSRLLLTPLHFDRPSRVPSIVLFDSLWNFRADRWTWFNFHDEFFFLFLLPPIILYPLIEFIFAIALAFSLLRLQSATLLGTFVASMVTGLLVYLGGVMFLMYRLPFVECLMFGSLISATDPVTVLSIFQELGSDVNLYALVFGESVLNDAILLNISLHYILIDELLALMQSTYSSMQDWMLTIPMVSNDIFDSDSLAPSFSLQNLECCLFVLFPYFSFIYMGFDIAMEKHSWAANVFGCGYLVNLARPAHRKIPMTHQKALWYSVITKQSHVDCIGLRGAMAFALALQSVHDLPEGHGQTIFTATTAIVVLTVLLIGGSTGTMLEALEVVGDSHDPSLGDGFEVVNSRYMTSYDDEDTPSGSGFRTKLREFHKSAASFTELDRNYLTPFFTSNNGDYDDEGNIQQHHEERIPFTRRGNLNNRG
ncbi:hypothetical protein CARUB_v10022249mg [Capsella rubella]|uniref:Cation/H+ exchanger transmembrane domain-containing protein n=1 Tax=Capsella rubella TaxID=81985 RepID=R0IDC0_9BRAS|nr:hypothetical protein CARUB_v10022249mg [Capsella rubella]